MVNNNNININYNKIINDVDSDIKKLNNCILEFNQFNNYLKVNLSIKKSRFEFDINSNINLNIDDDDNNNLNEFTIQRDNNINNKIININMSSSPSEDKHDSNIDNNVENKFDNIVRNKFDNFIDININNNNNLNRNREKDNNMYCENENNDNDNFNNNFSNIIQDELNNVLPTTDHHKIEDNKILDQNKTDHSKNNQNNQDEDLEMDIDNKELEKIYNYSNSINTSTNNIIPNQVQQTSIVNSIISNTPIILNIKHENFEINETITKKTIDKDLFPNILSIKPRLKISNEIENFTEILIYNAETQIFFKKILYDKDTMSKLFNCQYSKFVNVGNNSVLITGGISITNSLTSKSINNCFVLKWNSESSDNNSLQIEEYSQMNESRNRHNIIYLIDKNIVLVCSSLTNSLVFSAEILKLDKSDNYDKSDSAVDKNKQKWQKIKSMNESRGNATLVYVNNQYLYCFGGFNKKKKNLDSIEVIDTNTFSKWILVTLNCDGLNTQPLKYLNCCMGVINLNNTEILLCGGYKDDHSDRIYKIKFDKVLKPDLMEYKKCIPFIEKSNNSLFSSQSFIKIDEENFVNFSLDYIFKYNKRLDNIELTKFH